MNVDELVIIVCALYASILGGVALTLAAMFFRVIVGRSRPFMPKMQTYRSATPELEHDCFVGDYSPGPFPKCPAAPDFTIFGPRGIQKRKDNFSPPRFRR